MSLKKKKKKKKKLSKALSWQGNYGFANAGPNHAAGLKYYMQNEVMDQKMDFIWGWEWTASLKRDDEFTGKSWAINGQVLPPLRCAAPPSSEAPLPADEASRGVRQILLNAVSNDGAVRPAQEGEHPTGKGDGK